MTFSIKRNTSEPEISPIEMLSKFPGHVYWKDKDGIYLGCNEEQAESLGLKSPNEIIGKSDYDLKWGAQADELREIDLSIMAAKEPRILEEEVDTELGKRKTFLSKKMPLRDIHGDIVGIIGTSIDITDRKEIEEALREAKTKAEQASRVKSEFIANMSHDLRTPLSGMQALAEDIIFKAHDEGISKDASLLLQASRHLLNLIDDILQVSRLDSGQEKASSRLFMLPSLIHNTLNIMKPKALERSIKLTLAYDDRLPAQVVGDSLVLQRILVNLLSNALKFTAEHGAVDVAVKLNRIEDSQYFIDFTVADTGIGMPADKLGIIFEKFSRLAHSFQGQYTGSGMGLYMVKQYVEQMGGDIDVVSQEDEGSEFHCQIPFKMAQEELTNVPKNHGSPPAFLMEEQLEKPHVLVVEDNKIVQHSQLNKLNEVGCEVMLAENGAEARSYFKRFKFNLLIVDLGLPDVDGLTLIKQFRDQHENPNHLMPMVLLTAHATPEELERSELAGVTEVLLKPLMIDKLKQLLHDYV